jgi:hypothetical protein
MSNLRRRTSLVALALLISGYASAVTVEGNRYPNTIRHADKPLSLVGVGVREVTFMNLDVYTMGVYAETRTCSHSRLVANNEVKMLRMDFLRNVPGEKMRSGMQKTFDQRTSKNASSKLRSKIRMFVNQFGAEITEKTTAKLVYVPGQGTSTLINGKALGPAIPGHEFQKVLWSIWFHPETCCSNLIEGIDAMCKGGG